jgi:hypothetical protein
MLEAVEAAPEAGEVVAEPHWQPEDLSKSIAERRTRRAHILLPKRFRDTLPEPPPAIAVAAPVLAAAPQHLSIRNPGYIPHISETPRNAFGLWRRYLTLDGRLPSNDPDDLLTLADLDDDAENRGWKAPTKGRDESPYYPYPNRNSFRLGSWYWGDNTRKSQKEFKSLIDIVGDPRFSPDDVRETKWHKIDNILAGSEASEDEWVDEDAGWKKVDITISVPFHKRSLHPGARSFVIKNFYHRSIISVIRERLSSDRSHFRYEPYELHFQPATRPNSVRVYGELYTSPVFAEAHRTLQESPSEPGCHLPRCVVALMFWSDATKLTTFGPAKLWPLYLFFGNDSKYQRCKPSCHMCCHIAYFEKVCPYTASVLSADNYNIS